MATQEDRRGQARIVGREQGTARFADLFSSSVGRKLLTGLTGLGLTVFVIVHMIGNLALFSDDPGAYNRYADFLLGTGPILYVVEAILLVFALVHAYLGIQIYLGRKRARKAGYKKYRSSGRPSLQSFSSRTMIFTGLVLLVFLVIHLATFKFGPGIEEGYVATETGASVAADETLGPSEVEVVDGVVVMRDLRRLVLHKFQNPLYAFGYVFVMLLLGFHLRHGIWSALQSLGAMNPKLTPVVYTLGGILAVLVALGFLVLPLYIFFFVPDPGLPAALGLVP